MSLPLLFTRLRLQLPLQLRLRLRLRLRLQLPLQLRIELHTFLDADWALVRERGRQAENPHVLHPTHSQLLHVLSKFKIPLLP